MSKQMKQFLNFKLKQTLRIAGLETNEINLRAIMNNKAGVA